MTANKIFFVSLGCDKNRIDSEEMLGYLKDAGFSFTYDETDAEIIIVNTCAFIDPAKEESIETILEMAAYKESAKCKKLIVTGCLVQRYKEEILKELPEIDAVLGVNELDRITELVSDTVAEDAKKKTEDPFTACGSAEPAVQTGTAFCEKPDRVLTTGGHFEFLKIAEGCDKCCTYCVIPKIRGRYRSFPMDDLLKEARYLAEQGVKELIVVAQETTIYGKDLYGKDRLPELLNALSEIDGFEWIRLLYAYPEDISEELLHTIADNPKICHYIDMPIQHASDRILKKMGRRTTQADIKETIRKAREIIPDVALRTSLITGFPGETEEEHEELLKFIKEMCFDRLGVFLYSREEQTPAASFDGQVSEEVKVRRREELMSLQEQISEENLKKCVGKTFGVFVEGYLPEEDIYVGRTYMDAPEVDGCFFMKCARELMSGSIVKAKVLETNEYDMIGVVEE